MKKAIFFPMALIALAIVFASCTSKNKISQDEAIKIAIDFVEQRVKFTTTGDDGRTILSQASNTIKNAQLSEGNWYIDIYVESEVGEEIKKGSFTVTIDAETGRVLDLKQMPLIPGSEEKSAD
ncbi:MAG: PepSY domain-containing protein [Nanoarchaeota archaeon]|nr:PepSY domain-containing protein [Nanoarchaeota archaeon]